MPLVFQPENSYVLVCKQSHDGKYRVFLWTETLHKRLTRLANNQPLFDLLFIHFRVVSFSFRERG